MARVVKGRLMDGKRDGYIAGDDLLIDPSLRLWDEPTGEVDPVTFEVIRHNLWHVNEEHGETIVKVSGSPIAVFGQDFNPCLMDERGDYVFFGPYLQLHAGMQDLSAKWILENRSANPGIREGDMWLHNDPWVGTTHQSDAATLCPVFVDGRLFCWVGNTLHFVDVGGPTAGGWCPDANDVWDEPPTTPPMKIVEDGRLRADLEEEWTRRSRMPDLVALDLRAVIAGNNVARDRILALVERYGAATIKAVMRKITDDAERRFESKLDGLPDGTWRARTYLEAATEGDRGSYPLQMSLRKQGRELTFSSAGTHPAVGSLNLTYAGWRGAILAALGPLLCYDSLFAVGGAVRATRFEPEPGTILCAAHPSSVSNGGALGALATIALTDVCLANMMACSAELRPELTAPTGLSQWPVTALNGTDQHGKTFNTIILDWYLGTMGAQMWRDGIHTGGVYWGPYHLAPNVEQVEQTSPVLYLHRGEVRDGQGLGRHVSGAGPETAWTPHRTDRIFISVSTCGMGVPTAPGILGGLPGITNSLQLRRADGEERAIAPKEKAVPLEPGDVYEGRPSGGAGVEDPLLRDPELVAADVRDGYATAAAGRDYCGVVLDEAGAPLPEETARRRAEIRAERLGGPPRAECSRPEIADERLRIGEVLAVVDREEEPRFACLGCGADAGPAAGDFKEVAVRRDLPVERSGPLFADPGRFVDTAFELREYACGSCGTLWESEVAASEDPPLRSFALDLVRAKALAE